MGTFVEIAPEEYDAAAFGGFKPPTTGLELANGAALAWLAAQRAFTDGTPPRAVYAFGMPRVGGVRFEASYDTDLGTLACRLVHGIDLVAHVPMSSIGFRHVGPALQCATGAKFDAEQPLSQIGADDSP
jgi:triacylglycerol lipase